MKAVSKRKDCSELSEWIESIINHFWWSIQTCEGNPAALLERYSSVIHHIVNRHQWPGSRYFKKCTPPPEESRNRKWLKQGSPAHKALLKIVKDKCLLGNLQQCAGCVTTTLMEVYHSLYLKYLPKKQLGQIFVLV